MFHPKIQNKTKTRKKTDTPLLNAVCSDVITVFSVSRQKTKNEQKQKTDTLLLQAARTS